MTWRVALFRLWVLCAAMFVVAVASLSYGQLRQEFDAISAQNRSQEVGVVLPQLCANARGVAGLDYSTQRGREPGRWDVYKDVKPSNTCWYSKSRFRRLYPEFDKLSDTQLVRMLYSVAHEPIGDLPDLWKSLGYAASVAFGIPLIVLLAGGLLFWLASASHTRRGIRTEAGSRRSY